MSTCKECDWFEDKKCIYVNNRPVNEEDKACILFFDNEELK